VNRKKTAGAVFFCGWTGASAPTTETKKPPRRHQADVGIGPYREHRKTIPIMPPMAAYHNSSLFSLIFSLQKESRKALFLLYSSFSARYRATKMPLALAWDREWVTPLPSPMTNRPLWGVSRCSSSATSML